MKQRIVLSLLCGLVLLSACGPRKKTVQAPLNRAFPAAEVPSMITEPEQRAAWLAHHYWDRFTTPEQLYLCDSLHVNGVLADDLEKQVGIFVTLLEEIQLPDRGARAMENLYERMAAFQQAHPEGNLFQKLTEQVSRYVYDPNSPVRDEELYLALATRLASSELVEPLQRQRYAWEAEKCALNRPGTPAADFTFMDMEGRRRTLYGIRSELTLLIFGNPDCHACKELAQDLDSYAELTELMENGTLSVVDIYIDEDIDAWKAHRAEYPAKWINGYDPAFIIRTDLLYNVRALPSLYLLDAQKTVLLKDCTPEKLFAYLGY